MKKLGLVLLVVLMLVGCSTTGDDKKVYKIGVLQLADHPSLDATYDGMVAKLDELIGKDNYVLDYQNALGKPENVTLMAQKLVDDGNDLIYTIATGTSQAVYAAAENSGIPVVFNAVTDPVDAGLVDSMEKPGHHATGVSDVAPIDLQLALIKEIMPNVKNIGILYNTGEDNSRVQLVIAETEATKLGLTIVKQGVSSAPEIEFAATSLVEKVDALYNITDNLIVTATAQVVSIADEAKIPVFAAEVGQMEHGIFATASIDYYNLGTLGGEIIKEILVDGKSPADISVRTVTETETYLNESVAEALNIEIPSTVVYTAYK